MVVFEFSRLSAVNSHDIAASNCEGQSYHLMNDGALLRASQPYSHPRFDGIRFRGAEQCTVNGSSGQRTFAHQLGILPHSVESHRHRSVGGNRSARRQLAFNRAALLLHGAVRGQRGSTKRRRQRMYLPSTTACWWRRSTVWPRQLSSCGVSWSTPVSQRGNVSLELVINLLLRGCRRSDIL